MSPVLPIILHRSVAYLASFSGSLLSLLPALLAREGAYVPVPPGNLLKCSKDLGQDGPDAPSTETNGAPTGRLIINADDWGRDTANTDRTLDCMRKGTVSSVSAMVFMEDSERAAGLARDSKADVGLHLNLTSPFSSSRRSGPLGHHLERVAGFLARHRLSQILFSPKLMSSFEYLTASQIEEFARLYGEAPRRFDGHHHMHLSANVLVGGLLPGDTIVRRNFSFQPGEKGWSNRFYRQSLDRMLVRNHRVADFFFSLPPLDPANRLERIFALARRFVVEVETHPVNPEEYRFLAEGGMFQRFGDVSVASGFGIS